MSPKRSVFLVPCLCSLVLALAFSARPAAADGNMIANPGFEESLGNHPWMPAGWDTSRAGFSWVFFGRDTLSPHSGQYSASVANVSAMFTMSHNWHQMFLVGSELWGKDLVFSIWTRSLGVNGRAYIKLEAYRDTITKMAKIWDVSRDAAAQRLEIAVVDDPMMDLAWKRQVFSEPETDWVRREVRIFVPPSSNVVFVRCGLIGTGQVMLDDASLTVEPAAPAPEPPLRTNLLADPGFEGSGNDWEYSLPPYPDMKAERQSEVVHSGKSALRMTSPPTAIVPGKAGVAQVISNRALAGKRVRFTGWIKTDSLKSSAFLKVHCHAVRGQVQDASVQVLSGTNDWTQAVIEMDLPQDAYSLWLWFTYTAPAAGRVYFDDASFTVVGKATTKL